MPSFNLDWNWIDADDRLGLCGPEVPTFAALRIFINHLCLTTCKANSRDTEERDHVIGPLAGLADWLVDHWMEIFWQTHTPFPKTRLGNEHVPDYDDILKSAYQNIDIESYGKWYACHCFGHASSDLALPTILFIPEDTKVGIAWSPPPPSLDATCAFSMPQDRGIIWINKDELAAVLEGFITAIIGQANSETLTAPWAAWLHERFMRGVGQADDDHERRRRLFGDHVANHWADLEDQLAGNVKILNGILLDSHPIQSAEDISPLVHNVKRLATEQAVRPFWSSIPVSAGDQMLPPYERGYRKAESVRHALNLGDDPIDFHEVLGNLQIGLQKIQGPALARSAYMVSEAGVAEVCLFTSHPMAKQYCPRRFSLATALGGLLASQTHPQPFGGANSDQSRWLRSQEANAFAAMLLLPASSVEGGHDLEKLVEDYGISFTAAQWHIKNLRQRGDRTYADVS